MAKILAYAVSVHYGHYPTRQTNSRKNAMSKLGRLHVQYGKHSTAVAINVLRRSNSGKYCKVKDYGSEAMEILVAYHLNYGNQSELVLVNSPIPDTLMAI